MFEKIFKIIFNIIISCFVFIWVRVQFFFTDNQYKPRLDKDGKFLIIPYYFHGHFYHSYLPYQREKIREMRQTKVFLIDKNGMEREFLDLCPGVINYFNAKDLGGIAIEVKKEKNKKEEFKENEIFRF